MNTPETTLNRATPISSRTLTFLRGAATDDSDPDPWTQPLSKEGRKEAGMCRLQLNKPRFDITLCAPLLGMKETAGIVSGLIKKNDAFPVHDLFFSHNGKEISVFFETFDKLRHAPLSAYLRERPLAGMLEYRAKEAHITVSSLFTQRKARNGLVIVPDILIAAIGNKFTSTGGEFNDQMFGECEGFQLRFGELSIVGQPLKAEGWWTIK